MGHCQISLFGPKQPRTNRIFKRSLSRAQTNTGRAGLTFGTGLNEDVFSLASPPFPYFLTQGLVLRLCGGSRVGCLARLFAPLLCLCRGLMSEEQCGLHGLGMGRICPQFRCSQPRANIGLPCSPCRHQLKTGNPAIRRWKKPTLGLHSATASVSDDGARGSWVATGPGSQPRSRSPGNSQTQECSQGKHDS